MWFSGHDPFVYRARAPAGGRHAEPASDVFEHERASTRRRGVDLIRGDTRRIPPGINIAIAAAVVTVHAATLLVLPALPSVPASTTFDADDISFVRGVARQRRGPVALPRGGDPPIRRA